MPWSEDTFDEDVRAFLEANPFSRLLDIGAGAGKYGHMARAVQPGATIEAIEVVEGYVSRFDLPSTYTRTLRMSVEDFIDEQPDYETDVCIIGDCLEHLKKSAGLDVLHFMTYRCRWLLALFPKRYRQGSWEGNTSEAHRSVWGESDFAEFDHRYVRRKNARLAIVRGYVE